MLHRNVSDSQHTHIINLKSVKRILDALIENGRIKRTQLSAKQDLAKQALADALDQAQQIASGAGLSVKSIKNIQLSPLLTQDNIQRYGVPYYQITPSSFYSSGQMSITATVQFELGK